MRCAGEVETLCILGWGMRTRNQRRQRLRGGGGGVEGDRQREEWGGGGAGERELRAPDRVSALRHDLAVASKHT